MVRLYQGDYNQVTKYNASPVDIARYYLSLGFNYIHEVDLNGAKDGALTNLDVIKSIANLPGLMIQVGGGVRSQEHVQKLLAVGVSSVIVGSLFVQDYELAIQIVQDFPGKIIAGLDILDGCLATHGWTQPSQISLDVMIGQLSNLPLHSIVTTDISKDGTFEGLNVDLYRHMSTISTHSIVASGGVSTISDVIGLRDMNFPNVTGCIVGKAIIEGKITKDDVVSFV